MNKLFKVSTWPAHGYTTFTNWVGATNEQEAIEKMLANAINNKNNKVYYRDINELDADELKYFEDAEDQYIYLDLTTYGFNCYYLLIENLKVEEIEHDNISINELAELVDSDLELNAVYVDVYDWVINDVIDYEIDIKLTYTNDYWDVLKKYTTPSDLINGAYTIDDLLEDMTSDLEDLEVISLVIEHEGKKEFIQGLADFLE